MSLASLTPLAESPPSLNGGRPKSEGPVLTPNIEHPPPFPHPLAPNFSHFEHARHRSGSLTSSTVSKPEDYAVYAGHAGAYDNATAAALQMQAFSNPYASNVNLAIPVTAEFSNLSRGGHSPPGFPGVDHGINNDIFRLEEPMRQLSQQSDQLMYPTLSDVSPKLDQDGFGGSMYPHFSPNGTLIQENGNDHA